MTDDHSFPPLAWEQGAMLAHQAQEIERLKTMSTIEMMCENVNVDAHVREWEARCLNAEASLAAMTAERDEARTFTKTYLPDELDELKSLRNALATAQARSELQIQYNAELIARIAALQATLTAREARIRELEDRFKPHREGE